MRSEASVSLSLAVFCLALAGPALARAASSSSAASTSAASAAGGSALAMQMVPARAALTRDIDAAKIKSGTQIQIRLADKVHLKNGTELPSGTVLIGTVTSDHMKATGASRLALDFTQARLKNGSTMPIKATIVGVAPPEHMNDAGYDVPAGQQMPNTWNTSMLQIDAINALSGVDMHSKIDGQNSGVFISNKKHDMKFGAGTEFALAIGAAS